MTCLNLCNCEVLCRNQYLFGNVSTFLLLVVALLGTGPDGGSQPREEGEDDAHEGQVRVVAVQLLPDE